MTNTHLNRANQQYKNGELNQALESYHLALIQSPKSSDILHAIGAINAQLGQLDEALNYINQALKLSPNDTRILNSKANILARQNKIDEAITTYNQAIQRDQTYAVALSGLGKCLLQQGKLSMAEDTLQKALALKPNFIEAQYNYALVLTQQNEWDKAIELLESIVTEHPNFSGALGQLGALYLQKGDHQRALRVLDRRVAIDPEHSEAVHSLANAMALTDHLDESIEYYEKTLMLNPHHPEVNHNLGNAYLKRGDAHKALTYYFKQIALVPMAESYFNIGVIMMYQERNKEAIPYFEQAAEYDPTNSQAFLNLGAIYLKLQNYDKAIESYDKALAIEPSNEEINYIIDALKNDITPARAPNAYLKNLFNHYASYYDKHLTHYLDYTVPQQLAQLLFEALASEREQWLVIDLGCGTGLSGEAFKPFAAQLIGIDISDKMIEIAAHKNIYQKLIVGDIEQELTSFHDVDLIVAADVFSYLGDLETLLERAYNALKPSGLLIFSVERMTHGAFALQKNMRYAHSKEYIESLAQKMNFSIERCHNAVLRKQQKQPVEGFLVLLKKC